MAFVATATAVGGGSAILGGMLIGAGVGGAYSAITGDGNVLNSMLTGGLIGGAGAGLMGLGAAGGTGAATGVGGAGGAGGSALASQAAAPMSTAVSTGVPAGALAAPSAAPALTLGSAAPVSGIGTVTSGVAPAATGLTGMQTLGYGLAGTTALSLLGGRQKGVGAGQMPDPGTIRPFDYSSTPNEPTGIYPSPYATAQYDAAGMPIMDTRERNYFNQGFAALQPYSAKSGTPNPNIKPNEPVMVAKGGQIDDELGGDYTAMGMDQGNLQKGLFGMGYAAGGPVKKYSFGGLALIENMLKQAEFGQQMPKYQFDQNTQRYSVDNQPAMGIFTPSFGGYRFDPNTDRYSTNPQPMAAGGMTSLGGYSDGGRMLKGPGDGMSDSIPGVIGNKQPARLADGEFVVPADVVSHLGNGSTDAGAKRLYAMMDKVRKARTGNKKQGKQIKAEKYLPA